jgi:cell division protein FtsL
MRVLLKEWLRSRVADPAEANLERRVLTLLVANVILGLCFVWVNLMLQDLGYRVENTSKLIEKLDLEYAELVSEVTHETTPERLRRQAETKLGLSIPAAGQVMTIDAQP